MDQGGSDRRATSGHARHPAITAAAVLFLLDAGWVVSFFWITAYVVLNGELPTRMRYLAPHGRIYDAFGLDVALGAYGLYGLVSMLGILAGLWLWRSRRRGAVLGAIALAAGPPFWYGFGLPIPPYIAVLQLGLLAAGWRSLR